LTVQHSISHHKITVICLFYASAIAEAIQQVKMSAIAEPIQQAQMSTITEKTQ
jgi:hypothetical protein